MRGRQRCGSAPAHQNKLIASDWLVRVFNGRPQAGVDWAFPGNLPASPLFTRVSGMPARQPSIDADSRAIVAEMPNPRGRRARQLGVSAMPLRFSGLVFHVSMAFVADETPRIVVFRRFACRGFGSVKDCRRIIPVKFLWRCGRWCAPGVRPGTPHVNQVCSLA